MTTVLNPLAYKDIGPYSYYWPLLGTRNRVHMLTFLVGMQKAAVQEDPGREAERRNGQETVSCKTLQSGKFPGRETGREKPTFRKPTVRQDPGSFREENWEEM